MLIVYRETERDWDKDLAEDVKGECEQKYGNVERIKVEKESQVCYFPQHQLEMSKYAFRVRYMSSLTRLNRLPRPSRV